MANSKNLDFLSKKVREPRVMKEFLHSFLKEWRNFYPDQLKTYVHNIMYSKKVCKMEAIKELEDDITAQLSYFIDVYQSFPDLFRIYCFISSENLNKIIKGLEEDNCIIADSNLYVFWSWDKNSSFVNTGVDDDSEIMITGLILKDNVNWALTLLKNCEIGCGLDEKEVILFLEAKIKIIQIEGKNFLKELGEKNKNLGE